MISKRSTFIFSLLLATVFFSTSMYSLAGSASKSAGAAGTLRGQTTAYGANVLVETTTTKPATLYMNSKIVYQNTGATVGTPAYSYDTNTTRISDDYEMHHWHNKLKDNPKYVVYTSHEVRGSTSYVVYTSSTGTYTY